MNCYRWWDSIDGPQTSIIIILTSGCNHGDVRLVSGSSHYEGRVELCYNSVWGSVCESSWDTDNARVVCRQLGYSVAGNVVCLFESLITY